MAPRQKVHSAADPRPSPAGARPHSARVPLLAFPGAHPPQAAGPGLCGFLCLRNTSNPLHQGTPGTVQWASQTCDQPPNTPQRWGTNSRWSSYLYVTTQLHGGRVRRTTLTQLV